jgi:hypothetical protein
MFQRIARWVLFVVPAHLSDEHGRQLEAILTAARQEEEWRACMRNKTNMWIGALVLALVVGQALAWIINADGYAVFLVTLPVVLSQIAFWGPIIALIAGLFILMTLRLLGFSSLGEIRSESVDQNNPTPAIIFVGTLIASLLFLSLVIRP